MSAPSVPFQRIPIRPLDCLAASKDLLAGHYWLFFAICLVGMLIASAAPMAILMGPMMCGLYYCYLRRLRGESLEFAMLFKGFDCFVESLVATLILVAIMLVVMVPLCVLLVVGIIALAPAGGGRGGDDAAMLAMFGMIGVFYALLLLLSVVIGLFFTFAYPLIIDRGLTAVPALKLSCRAAWANFGGLVGLMCLILLISLAATLCCYVPALFVLPLTMGALAVAYRKVFPDEPQPAK